MIRSRNYGQRIKILKKMADQQKKKRLLRKINKKLEKILKR